MGSRVSDAGGMREIVTLLAIAAGFAAIGVLGARLSGLVDGTLLRLSVLMVLFVGGYAIVFLAGSYGVRLLMGADKKQGDRVAGGVFGVLRGWILGAFAFYTISVYHTGAPLPRAISESAFAPALEETVRAFLRNADLHVTHLSNTQSRAISPLTG